MSDQSHSWYVRGKGNQPTGPFPSEQLIQSWRAGRLDPNTICWCEGMAQWLPMSQVDPFASTIRSASVSSKAATKAGQVGALPIRPTKRPLLLVGAAVAGLLLLYLLWTLFVASFLGSGYRAEYRPLIENGQPFLEVLVTGKAAKLAVMLTDPKGKTETQVIEENEMITNAKTVRLAMQQKPEAGTYTLLVKTFQPERVVYKATPKFTRGRLTILDAQFKWKPWTGGGHQQPEAITLTVENQGSLPVCFDRLVATIGEQRCEQGCFVEGTNGRMETVRVGGAFFVRDSKLREAEMRRRRACSPWWISSGWISGDNKAVHRGRRRAISDV